jgi:hypothetical protein
MLKRLYGKDFTKNLMIIKSRHNTDDITAAHEDGEGSTDFEVREVFR